MKVITVETLCELLRRQGLRRFLRKLIDQLQADFSRWQAFHLTPRHAIHYPQGVMELMPCADAQFYSMKYVNGHPANTRDGRLSVVALGLLARVSDGYPLLLSEMTLLTALRTAAAAALAAKYLARPESTRLALIGCGAQAEFQVQAFCCLFPIRQLRLFDIDPAAVNKCRHNLQGELAEIIGCESVAAAIAEADIVVTATAAKKREVLFGYEQLRPGTHIQAMGGDCPGKTEFAPDLLRRAKVVVEYAEQSLQEGELQQLDNPQPYAELWQLVQHDQPGRENSEEITLFDSVGVALEDYSALRLLYELSEQEQLGLPLALIPELDDPKNLYGLLSAGL